MGYVREAVFYASQEANFENDMLVDYMPDGFMAPEAFAQKGDEASDIYANGMIMYNMLTGLNPSDPPYSPEPMRSRNPTSSRSFEKTVCRCIHKNPEERVKTLEDLLCALNASGERRLLLTRFLRTNKEDDKKWTE